MIKVIQRKYQQLTPENIIKVQKFVNDCAAIDNFRTPFYWSSIENRRNDIEADFIATADDEIVSYIACYHFSQHEAEISVLLHPDFRGQKIFSSLWNSVKSLLIEQGLHNVIFKVPEKSLTAVKILNHLQAQYKNSDYRLKMLALTNPKYMENLNFRLASYEDLTAIAEIENLCFGTKASDYIDFLKCILKQDNYKIWVAELSGKIIAKVQVELLSAENLIFGLGVLPELQNQGIGSTVLSMAAIEIFKISNAPVILDVEHGDSKLIEYYKNFNFHVIEKFDYWSLKLQDYTIH